MAMTRQRYQLIPPRDTNYQRILGSNWARDTWWSHPSKNNSLTCYLALMTISIKKNLRYQLIPSRKIVDQRIPQSDWTKGTPGTPNQN